MIFFLPVTNTNNTSSKEIRCSNLSLTILSKDSVQGEGAMRVTLCWAPSHTRGAGNGTLTVGPVWDLKPESRTPLQQSGSVPTELTRRWQYLCYQDYELKLWHKVWMTLTDNFWEYSKMQTLLDYLGKWFSQSPVGVTGRCLQYARQLVLQVSILTQVDQFWVILRKFQIYETLFEVE